MLLKEWSFNEPTYTNITIERGWMYRECTTMNENHHRESIRLEQNKSLRDDAHILVKFYDKQAIHITCY